MRNNYLILFFSLFFSCSDLDRNVLKTYSGRAQGTYYHIKYLSEGSGDLKFQIDSLLIQIDNSLSIYKDNSLISKLNSGDEYNTDSLFNSVFTASNVVFKETEGYFDCSIGPVIDYWGFYDKKFPDSILIDSSRINKIISKVGFDKISLFGDSLVLPKGMRLDFNSIAQGFSVDVIANFFQSKGIHNYMIELGGEVSAKGLNADRELWRIGIEKPSDKINRSKEYQFILSLEMYFIF